MKNETTTVTVANADAVVNTPEVRSVTVIKPREFHPKRGIKGLTLTLKDPTIQFKPHHQKALILELLKGENTKSMDLVNMVKLVEEDEKLWTRLQSKQSVFNCITYHMKDLAKLGVIEVK